IFRRPLRRLESLGPVTFAVTGVWHPGCSRRLVTRCTRKGSSASTKASKQGESGRTGRGNEAGLRKSHGQGERKGTMRRNEQGFTLIELLVVVAIIGILAAIAIPQFSAYRAQGFNARASSDLRNLATAEEAYFAANAAYTTTLSQLTGFKQSPGVIIAVGSVTSLGFTGQAHHGSGNKTFDWDSVN